MLLYKLRERQSWGRGSHGALCCLPPHQCPAPAWDRSRTQQGHEHQILQGIKKKRAWGHRGHPPSTASSSSSKPSGGWAAWHPPRLPWPLASSLLLRNATSPVPAQLGSERKRLEGLCSSSKVGGKSAPCSLERLHSELLPLSAAPWWSHSTLSARQASAALLLKSRRHLAGLGRIWGQIP